MHADLEQIAATARPMHSSDQDSVFWPSAEFRAQANAHRELYAWAQADYRSFWADQARTLLDWDSPFQQILAGNSGPRYRWFPDGTLNACHNALDRHIDAGDGDRIALHFEPESGAPASWTYSRLHEQVCRAANAFSEAGIDMGDRVAICLPTGPEAIIAMLACARIGAIHVVLDPELAAESLRPRLSDAGVKACVVADAVPSSRGVLATKAVMDQAAQGLRISAVFVVHLGDTPIELSTGEQWWQEALDHAAPDHVAAAVRADHPLFVLYAERPEGLVGIVHSTGGYLTQVAHTTRAVLDLKPEADMYWCAASLSDIRGHSYQVYGPLLAGATQLIYPGAPTKTKADRWWELIEKYRVSVFYADPAAIGAHMAWSEDLPAAHDLSSLRLIACGGESLSAETWLWLRRVIAGNTAPVLDTWLQPETGAIAISPLPAVTDTKPASINQPIPGLAADVVDAHGAQVPQGQTGHLVLTEPWPAMLIGIWGSPEANSRYWTALSGRYFTGEMAHRDDDGDLWIDHESAEVAEVAEVETQSDPGATSQPDAEASSTAEPAEQLAEQPTQSEAQADVDALPEAAAEPEPDAQPESVAEATPAAADSDADAAAQSIPSPPAEPQPTPAPSPTPYPSPEPLPHDASARRRPHRKSKV